MVGRCGNWFISGSSRGILALWDHRFLLPVNSWNYPTVSPIEKLCLFIPPPNSMSSSGRPLVFVAAGCNEVSLWNAENGNCHQMFRTASTENEAVIPKTTSRPFNKTMTKDVRRAGNYKYRIEELSDPLARLPGIRSLLPLPGGDLLTGGTDLKIRYWDQARPEQSFCIAGPSAKGVGNDECYDIRSSFGIQVVQEMCKQPTTASRLTHKTPLAIAAADSAWLPPGRYPRVGVRPYVELEVDIWQQRRRRQSVEIAAPARGAKQLEAHGSGSARCINE